MGNVKTVDEYLSAASDEGMKPEPIEVASRVVAHIAHRMPFVKKVTKRFEGKDKRAGIFSDTLALISQLAGRNEDLIREQGAEIVAGMFANNGRKTSPPKDVVHVEFGPTDPISKPN